MKLFVFLSCFSVFQFVLLGAEEGLFIFAVGKQGHDNKPRQIPGVGSVYQIEIQKQLGLALLISGTNFPLKEFARFITKPCFFVVCFPGVDRELLSVDLKQLEACTKQSREVPLSPLEFQNVGNITNCHLFASKKVTSLFCSAFPLYSISIFLLELIELALHSILRYFVSLLRSKMECSFVLLCRTKSQF